MNKATLNGASRIIGIRHRVKQTAEGEARPTQLAISVGDSIIKSNLADEDAELQFLKAGLKAGDTVLMTLGGSGDNLAFALSRSLETTGGQILRVPPRILKEFRGDRDKDDDSLLLLELYQTQPEAFYAVGARDRDLIRARECYRLRIDAMKARIACEQRIRSSLVGSIFCSEDGMYPEGELEKLFDAAKANDVILQGVLKDEKRRENAMAKSLEALPVYRELFAPIKGVGPAIAARIICNIGDIRLFSAEDYPGQLIELKRQSDDLETKVFEPMRRQFARQIDTAFAEQGWSRLHPMDAHFHTLGLVAKLLREDNRRDEANQVQRCIELHKQRWYIRQKSQAKLKAFCGVHLVADGEGGFAFARRRRGATCNWNPEVRQALFLLGDQFNRRPDTVWGQRQRDYKARVRSQHPEPETKANGKKAFTDAHVHKTATWKALTKFVEWLWDEWSALETGVTTMKKAA